MATRSSVLAVVGLVLATLACGQPAGGRGDPPAAVRSGAVDVLAEVRLVDDLGEPGPAGLPEVLVLSGEMGTAHVAPAELDLAGAPAVGGYRAGDLTYWPEGRQVVLFLADGTATPPGGLVLLGRVTTDLGELAGCSRDCAVRLVTAPVGSGAGR